MKSWTPLHTLITTPSSQRRGEKRAMESFNEAVTYDKNSSVQREDGLKLINLLDLESGSKILDLGCGTGYLTKVLAEKVGCKGKVLGIDPDLQRLQVAMEKYPASNLKYQEGISENITGKEYDVVFSNSVLHWCKDKDLVFKQVAESLKQGGKFGFVATADFNAEEEFFTPPSMFSPECLEVMTNNLHVVASDKYLKLATDNGFRVTYYNRFKREWKFDNIYKLIEFFMTHWKGQLKIEQFNVEAMKQRYGNGSFTITMPYIAVLASTDV